MGISPLGGRGGRLDGRVAGHDRADFGFLFVEYGADFASQAALGTLYAMPAIAATAVGYRIAVSLGSGWIVSQLVSQSGYVGMVLLLSVFKPGVAPVFLLSMLSIVVGLAAMRPTGSRALPAFSSNQVLVIRMVSTTALVLIITTLASFLGPTLSGLLSTVLILAGVLAAAAPSTPGSRNCRWDQKISVICLVTFCHCGDNMYPPLFSTI